MRGARARTAASSTWSARRSPAWSTASSCRVRSGGVRRQHESGLGADDPAHSARPRGWRAPRGAVAAMRRAHEADLAALPGEIETILNEHSGLIRAAAYRHAQSRTGSSSARRLLPYRPRVGAEDEGSHLHSRRGMAAGFLKHGRCRWSTTSSPRSCSCRRRQPVTCTP